MASPVTSGHLLLAGLDSERDATLIQTRAPDLWRLLRRAAHSEKISGGSSPTQTLLQLAGWPVPQTSAIAALCALADGLDSQQGHWLLADPVQLIPDMDRVHLHIPRLSEKAQMSEGVVALLNEESIQMHIGNSGQHYLSYKQHIDWSATALTAAANSNLYHGMPQGEDGGYWRRLTTEIQMQIAITQPENSEFNAWWFWGNGVLPNLMESQNISFIGDGRLLKGIAKYLQLTLNPALDSNFEEGNKLLIYKDLSRCILDKEKSDKLADLQRTVLNQLYPALKKGRVHPLEMETDDGCWSISRSDTWKFWRK